MIIIKGKQLVDLRIGNTPVVAWYRGDVQYWGGSQPQPAEYTELEWISSGDYNDWLAIDTGVLACNQYRVVADIQWNAHNTQVQRFGSQWCTGPGTSGDYYTFAFGTTESGWSMNTGFASSGGKWEISSSRDTNRHVFDAMFYAPYTGKFDSTTHTFPNTGSAQPPSEENTLMLFARHRWTGYGVEIDNYCSCKLYSCQIYDAQGNLVRDFVPATIDDGAKVGMWDKVTSQFYWSTRESNFDPGPAKEATPIVFNYVNGVVSSTTYYTYSGVLYIDQEMTQTASSGTYVNASYRYTVSGDGSYTTESYSSYSSVTPSATLYVTSAKAYSNPGLTTYATAGTYVSTTESLVVTSNGSYTRTPLSPYRYLDGAVFSGSQYIKTGIKLQRYDTVYYDFIPTSTTTSRYPLGVRDSTSSTSSNRFYMNVSSATNIQLYNVSRTASNISYSVNNALQGNISVGNRTFTYELYVGAMNSVGSATGAWSGVVKSFKIVRSNNDIINLVPVERLSDHKIGFYNSVDDTFVACTGGDPTEWTASGPYVELAGVKCASSGTWIDTGINPQVGDVMSITATNPSTLHVCDGVQEEVWCGSMIVGSSGYFCIENIEGTLMNYTKDDTTAGDSIPASPDTKYSRSVTCAQAVNQSVFLGAMGGYPSCFFTGIIHEFTYTRGGTTLMHLIPVRRNSDSVVCMYDTVSETFKNPANGVFTAVVS